MKKLIILVCLLLSSIALAETALYTTDTLKPKSAADIRSVLENFTENYPDKNILFYVHGRSKTFDSEYESSIEMEKVYNVKVIMLRWNSWLSPIQRPVDNAKKASQLLNDSLEEFNNLKLLRSDLFARRKLLFLSHSMGNITLKNYMENFNSSSLDPNLFDSMVLSGADVPFREHDKWLSQVDFTTNLSVIVNQNDIVLKASTMLDFPELNFRDDRLGLGFGLDRDGIFSRHSAPNATYFDITKINKAGHRHFLSTREDVRYLYHHLFLELEGPFALPFKKKDNLITILKR